MSEKLVDEQSLTFQLGSEGMAALMIYKASMTKLRTLFPTDTHYLLQLEECHRDGYQLARHVLIASETVN